jgi:drug/metabolite transporter (DMT)-like permease
MPSAQALYALVLLAAVAHAAWNALVKGAADPLLMLATMRGVGLAFGLVLLPLVPWPGPRTWPWIGLAALGHYAYYALLLRSYRGGDLSLAYPIARGLAPLLLAALAFASIGERLTPGQVAAVGLAAAGILALVLGRGGDARTVRWAAATAVAIAAYSFCGGLGVRASGSALAFQAWLEILTGTGTVAFALARRGRGALAFVRASGVTGLVAGVISVMGYLAFLAAARVLPLAPVSALRETSVIFGAMIGAVVFREGFGPRRVAAAGLVALGIVALSLTGA